MASVPHSSFPGTSKVDSSLPAPLTPGCTKIGHFCVLERIGHEASLSSGVLILHGTLTQKICSPPSNPVVKLALKEPRAPLEAPVSFPLFPHWQGAGQTLPLCPGSPWFSFWFLLLGGRSRSESPWRSPHLCVPLVFSLMPQALG